MSKKGRRVVVAPESTPEDASALIGRDILLRAANGWLNLTSWKVALIFLTAGFGALSLFYAGLAMAGSPLLSLRGLFSYYSATIGDGLLLPLAVAVSTTSLRDIQNLLHVSLRSKDLDLKIKALSLQLILRSRALGFIPCTLALVLSIGVHVLWLLNPKTEPNWTITPGHLNFFGYWHAVFFFLVLWWLLAFLARLFLVMYTVVGYSPSTDLAVVSLRIWAEVNVFSGMLLGFATLLYVDNYGLRFSWHVLFSSLSTLMTAVSALTLLFGVNLYFARAIYRPARRRTSTHRSEIFFLAERGWTAFVFAMLLVGTLLLIGPAMSGSSAWPTAAAISGVFFPMLFAEGYAADVYWNHRRSPDSVESLGICLILILSSVGFLMAAKFALEGSSTKLPIEIAPLWFKSLIVSLLMTAGCIAIGWIASKTVSDRLQGERWYLTDHPPIHNLTQNLLQYWGLFQFITIPAAIFVYHAKVGLSHETRIALLAVFSTLTTTVILFPLANNYSHLRDLGNRANRPPSYNFITAHILFMTLYVGGLTVFVLGWVWLQAW